jgi:hypothetical protein
LGIPFLTGGINYGVVTLKVMMLNTGTATDSLVLTATDFSSNSGGETSANPAWKAVDGKYLYTDYAEGWDANIAPANALPSPPKPIPSPPPINTNKTSWKWDGLNGNNGIWFGSTKAGVRVELKGDDPLWWAGVPYDSGSTPEPPKSWSNGGKGGIDGYQNGTAIFYSGNRSMAAGDVISYSFSVMVTPVRPFNLTAQFGDRWAQVGGVPINYTDLADKGVTVAPCSLFWSGSFRPGGAIGSHAFGIEAKTCVIQ